MSVSIQGLQPTTFQKFSISLNYFKLQENQPASGIDQLFKQPNTPKLSSFSVHCFSFYRYDLNHSKFRDPVSQLFTYLRIKVSLCVCVCVYVCRHTHIHTPFLEKRGMEGLRRRYRQTDR